MSTEPEISRQGAEGKTCVTVQNAMAGVGQTVSQEELKAQPPQTNIYAYIYDTILYSNKKGKRTLQLNRCILPFKNNTLGCDVHHRGWLITTGLLCNVISNKSFLEILGESDAPPGWSWMNGIQLWPPQISFFLIHISIIFIWIPENIKLPKGNNSYRLPPQSKRKTLSEAASVWHQHLL